MIGDVVVGLVMEIFMINYVFNIEVVFIGGGIGMSQNIFGVKDVEFFVFYGIYIKEVDGDNYIDIEVVFEVKVFFILFYRVFQ